MGFQSLDLVYELQVELGWEQEFASAARKEYMRWLQIRAKAGDFQSCKLPPSRVVAMVWNLHRQWTMDYDKTCASLGGFIHHYPPAMRLSFSREQAYAITYQTYKAQFKEDPPSEHWGPPICQSRPNSAPPGLLPQGPTTEGNGEGFGAAAASHPAPSVRALRRQDRAYGAVNDRKSTSFSRVRRKTAIAAKQNIAATAADEDKDFDMEVPSEHVEIDMAAQPAPLVGGIAMRVDRGGAMRGSRVRMEGARSLIGKVVKTTKGHRGGKKVQEGFVLRPLPAGEKRKRGRPSLSDYIPASQLAEEQTAGIPKSDQTLPSGEPANASTATPALRPVSAAASSPKTRSSSKPQARTIAPRPAAEVNGGQSLPQVLNDEADGTGKTGDAGTKADTAKGSNKKSRPQPSGSVRIGPDGLPMRRPRGRPRKDGSWPIPRAQRQQMQQGSHSGADPTPETAKAAPSQPGSQSVAHPVAVSAASQEEYIPSAEIQQHANHGDAGISTMEAHVGQQVLVTDGQEAARVDDHKMNSRRGTIPEMSDATGAAPVDVVGGTHAQFSASS